VFKGAYNAAGTAMIVMPVIIAVLQFIPGARFGHYMFWIECAGIWSFSAYWFVKTIEYRLLLRIKWMA
jgi:hypothetical protein